MAYTSTATIKTYLGVPVATETEDDAIADATAGAEAAIDAYCGRTFTVPAAVSTREMSPWSATRVVLPAELAQTDDLVVKTDTTADGVFDTTLDAAAYFVGPRDVAPFRELTAATGSWPQYTTGRRSVQVEGWWGYAMAVPAAVVQAATILGARLYQRRSSPLGLQAGMSPEVGPVRISRTDPDVAGLLVGLRILAAA